LSWRLLKVEVSGRRRKRERERRRERADVGV